jgi:hypothetical protein
MSYHTADAVTVRSMIHVIFVEKRIVQAQYNLFNNITTSMGMCLMKTTKTIRTYFLCNLSNF